MKFISYSHNGEHKFGILDNDLITDLTGKISGANSLKDLILKKGISEAKKYARQCLKLKKTYGGAYFELGVAELNLCNKSSSLKALKKAAKYDRRYRSEVKRIIKKMDAIMNHCENN